MVVGRTTLPSADSTSRPVRGEKRNFRMTFNENKRRKQRTCVDFRGQTVRIQQQSQSYNTTIIEQTTNKNKNNEARRVSIPRVIELAFGFDFVDI
jgi:hypothetical protein